MDKNPFSELIGIFREEGSFYNEPSFYVGIVESGLPGIKVATSGIVLDASSLMIDTALTVKDALRSGDTVILLRNNNKFYIISKVVRP